MNNNSEPNIDQLLPQDPDASLPLDELEKYFADSIGTDYAVVVGSGRAGIMYALLAMGFKPSSEVIIPDFSCEAVPISVLGARAMPVFCDVDPKSLNLDIGCLRDSITPRTRAVLVVHLYGIPVDVAPVREICEEKDLCLIEDAAQACGTRFKGKRIGSFGDVGIFSFAKCTSVPYGGAITTNDGNLANRIRDLRNARKVANPKMLLGRHKLLRLLLRSKTFRYLAPILSQRMKSSMGRRKNRRFWVDEEGFCATSQETYGQLLRGLAEEGFEEGLVEDLMSYDGKSSWDYLMDTLDCTVVKDQLGQLENQLNSRRAVARIYSDRALRIGLTPFAVPNEAEPGYFKFPVLLHDDARLESHRLASLLGSRGVHIDYHYRPLHLAPMFRDMGKKSDFVGTDELSRRLLPLPLDPTYTKDKIERIMGRIEAAISESALNP